MKEQVMTKIEKPINIIAALVAVIVAATALGFFGGTLAIRVKFLEGNQGSFTINSEQVKKMEEQIQQMIDTEEERISKIIEDFSDSNNIITLSNNIVTLPIGTILPVLNKESLDLKGEWLLCDGESVPTSQYRELAKALGYGSTSSVNFNLPDLREKFLRGSANNQELGNDAGQNSIDYSQIFTISTEHTLGQNDDGFFHRGQPSETRLNHNHSHTLETNTTDLKDNNVPAYLAVNFFIRAR